MKKILKMLHTKMNNIGSSLVLVIVALAFIGILAGALLTAVGSVYRLKLYDYNAKDNFYYLEIAMNEVYAGVGNSAMDCLKQAYTDTIEDMVRYDADKKSYVTVDQATAKAYFDSHYYGNVQSYAQKLKAGVSARTIDMNITGFETNPQSYNLVEYLSSFISNSDVEVVPRKITVEIESYTLGDPTLPEYICKIKNVTLKRTGKYNRSSANGTFEQTISADITLGAPDLDIKFDFLDKDASDVYDYAMIADSGIEILRDEINEANASSLSRMNITGNIYAGSDYYNKAYNGDYRGSSEEQHRTTGFKNTMGVGKENLVNQTNNAYNKTGVVTSGISTLYSTSEDANFVSSKNIPSIPVDPTSHAALGYYNYNMAVVNSQIRTYNNGGADVKASLVNKYLTDKKGIATTDSQVYYNGVSMRSLYSGLYVDNSEVNILASRIIVPGTIAIMNNADLNVYGLSTSGSANNTSLWADNIVFDDDEDKKIKEDYHPTAVFRADMHVRDDLEMNADYSEIYLKGNYYGFGNGTKKDNRVFTDMVDDTKFNQIEDGKIRSHYTTSSIVINGQNSKLDLSDTNNLFIAGRAYIELSKDKKTDSADKKYFEFSHDTNDFKTGESVAIKTNQRAYNTLFLDINVDSTTVKHRKALKDNAGNNIIPDGCTVNSADELLDSDGNFVYSYYEGTLDSTFSGAVSSPLFKLLAGGKDANNDQIINGTEYNTSMTTVPCKKITVGTGTDQKTYYYVDFDEIWYENYYNPSNTIELSIQYSYRENGSTVTVPVDTTLGRPTIGTPYYDILSRIQEKVVLKNADDLSKYYISYYNIESDNEESEIQSKLINLAESIDGFDFDDGEIKAKNFNSFSGQKVYSSGALNAKEGTAFEIVADDDTTATMMARLKEFADTTTDVNAAQVSDDFEERYAYTKWTLVDYNKNDNKSKSEYDFIQDLTTTKSGDDLIWGESFITPINKYFNFNHITGDMMGANSITPDSFQLSCGYKVYVSNSDVNIHTDADDGVFQGIVFTKGSVFFDSSVKKFEGMIVSGDKIFVYNENNNLNSISANPEVVKSIMAECETMDTNDSRKNNARKVLSIVKAYERFAYDNPTAEVDDGTTQNIDTLKYTDVVKFENWMKNVSEN